MIVESDGIVSGRFADRYGAKGTEFVGDMPSHSIPFRIRDAPKGTVCFAVVFEDFDAVPVCGFDWIHWTVADLTSEEVPEGESGKGTLIEGCNSWHGIGGDLTREQASAYGGMAPPDKEHEYTLTVYALDCKTGLGKGFYLNELRRAMKGHVLAHCTVAGTYAP